MKNLCIFILLSVNILSVNLYSQNPEWVVYNTSNSALPYNQINTIAIDGKGNKWIGTINGLLKIDGFLMTLYNTSNSDLKDIWINTILIDSQDNKWIGAVSLKEHGGFTGGLTKFDNNTWIEYNSSNSGLYDYWVQAIAIDRDNNKWIGGKAVGLAKFDGNITWNNYYTANSELPNNNVTSIAIDTMGNKWIGTFGGGLVKFDGFNWKVYNTSNSGLPDNSINTIVIDAHGIKWIGTNNGGLAKFNDSIWTIYNTSNSRIPNNYIYSLAIDTLDNIWIGGAVLAKFNRDKTWKIYNTSNSGLPNMYVNSIAIDNQGNKWIGTDGGLAVYREGGVYLDSNKIYGTVTHDNKISSPLSDVKLILRNESNEIIDSTLTDITGNYRFNDIADGTYTIYASTNKPSGGFDPVDALLINRFYMGTYNFPNNLRRAAADLNGDNKLNPQDALMIIKVFYGAIDSLGWIFDTTQPVVKSGENVVYNIKGICRGDVNASFKP
jgi:hypothetical protein